MCRGSRDGNRVGTFYLIKEDIYPRHNVLVGDRFDGPSSKQLHTTIALRDDVVARGGGRIQVLAQLLDAVKGVVHGTEFSGIARGSQSTESIRARGGRGYWAPYRPGVGSSLEGDVDPPADGSSGESRAVSEEKSRRIIKQRVPRSRGLRHVFLSLLPCGEALHVGRGPYRLRLSLSRGGVNTRNIAASDCIEDRGSGGHGSMALKTPTLYGAEEDRISFGCAGEGCVVSCLLTSSPNYVNPVDQVLAQSEKTFAQCWL